MNKLTWYKFKRFLKGMFSMSIQLIYFTFGIALRFAPVAVAVIYINELIDNFGIIISVGICFMLLVTQIVIGVNISILENMERIDTFLQRILMTNETLLVSCIKNDWPYVRMRFNTFKQLYLLNPEKFRVDSDLAYYEYYIEYKNVDDDDANVHIIMPTMLDSWRVRKFIKEVNSGAPKMDPEKQGQQILVQRIMSEFNFDPFEDD